MIQDKIKQRLDEAFANPKQKFCFYSVASAETGSDRLNNIPYWDWVPVETHQPRHVSACLTPLAFGCLPLDHGSGLKWCEPMITDAAQIKDLEIPDPYQGSTGKVLESIIELIRTTPENELVRCPDIQSPLGIAELMWDESFYIALMENPDAIHELLDKVTAFQIEFVKAVQKEAGTRYNPCGFPKIFHHGTGTMIADDTMSLISPEMHAEFSVPYLNRIGDEVGPIFYHSCTWREKYYENIKQIRNVKTYNWNPGNSDDPARLIREFSGRAVLALHLCNDMHKDSDILKLGHNFADEAEFFEYCLDAMTEETCLYWWFSNIRTNGPVMDKIYDMLYERGYTPQNI